MPQLTHHFKDMINKLDSYDVILISRYVKGGGDQRSKMRILSSKIINFICSLFLGSDIKEYTSSILIMKRRCLINGVTIGNGHGEFFVEFLYKADKKGNNIIEIPYVHPNVIEGNSKSFPNLGRFLLLGFFYILRLFQSIFRI